MAMRRAIGQRRKSRSPRRLLRGWPAGARGDNGQRPAAPRSPAPARSGPPMPVGPARTLAEAAVSGGSATAEAADPPGCARSPSRAAPRPRTFSAGPPSAGKSLSSSLQTNIGSLFQYMALPYHIPAPGGRRAGSGDPAPVSALSACRKKVLFSSGWTCPAGLTSCTEPAFQRGGAVISTSEPVRI